MLQDILPIFRLVAQAEDASEEGGSEKTEEATNESIEGTQFITKCSKFSCYNE